MSASHMSASQLMDDSTSPPATVVPEAPSLAGPRRWLALALGLFFVGLAFLGVFLPVLPTTPFLILASACFVRSSPRLHGWLLRSRLFGPMLRDWQQHRRVRRRVKYLAVGVLLGGVSLSAWLGQLSWPWLTLLIVLATIGLVVVLRLREMEEQATSLDFIPDSKDDTCMKNDSFLDLEEVCRQANKGIVRDPELLSRVYERTQRERDEILRKFGVQDLAADIIREIRSAK